MKVWMYEFEERRKGESEVSKLRILQLAGKVDLRSEANIVDGSGSYFGILIEMEKGPPFTLNNQLTSADPYPVVKIDLKPISTGISISVKKSVIRTRYG